MGSCLVTGSKAEGCGEPACACLDKPDWLVLTVRVPGRCQQSMAMGQAILASHPRQTICETPLSLWYATPVCRDLGCSAADAFALQVEIDYKAECHSGDTVEALGRHVEENTNGTGVRRQALHRAAQLCVAICDCLTAAGASACAGWATSSR